MGPRTRRLAVAVAGLAVAACAPIAAGDEVPQQVVGPRFEMARGPAVAVAPGGAAVVAWVGGRGPGDGIRARVRPARGAPWGPIRTLAAPTLRTPSPPVAALAADGTVTVAWRGPSGAVMVAEGRPLAEPGWRTARIVPSTPGFVGARLAGGPRPTLVWAERHRDGWRVQVHRRTGGGVWPASAAFRSEDLGLAPAGTDLPPRLAVNAAGSVAAIWPPASFAPRTATEPVRLTTLAPGARAWGAPATLGARGGDADVALSPAGHVGATWIADADADPRIEALVVPPGAAVSAPEVILRGTAGQPGASFPRIAVNRGGDAVVAWTQGAQTPAGLSLRARRRSGASGLWGPERVVEDRFLFYSVFELMETRVAMDERRVAHVAWMDPDGPGTAFVHAARGVGDRWERVATLGVGEDITEPALAVDARGGALVATPRVIALGEPNRELVLASYPEPVRPALTASGLLISQRIAQAALRRLNAVRALLEGGVPAERIRPGTVGADRFAPGITIAGTPGPEPEPPPPLPLPLPLPADRSPEAGAPVRVSVTQLRINQRIARAAVRRATAIESLLAAGLDDALLAPGAITPAALLPGLTIASVAGSGPAPREVRPAPADGDRPDRIRLTAGQLQINQRIAQAAVLRADRLVERAEGRFTGADIRPGGIGPRSIGPGD